MKEFFQELVKQKSSMLILAGILLLVLGITSGLKAGSVSVSVEPAYRIVSIVLGALLILIGIIFAWKDSSESKSTDEVKGRDKYSGKGEAVLGTLLEKATQIDAIGYSLRTLIHNRQNFIIDAVRRGGTVRLLILDPNGKAVEVMKRVKPETGVAKDILRSLEIAQIKIQEQIKQAAGAGRFEIRVIDWIPSCSLLILNGTTEDAWMEVGYFPPNYKYVVGHKVYIQFSKKKEKSRFDDYYEEFNDLWTTAKPYDLPG